MPPAKGKLASENVAISMTKLHRILRPLRTKTVALAETLNQPSIRHAITGGNNLRSQGILGQHSENALSSSSPASRFHPTPSPKRMRQTSRNFMSEQPFGHLTHVAEPTRRMAQGSSNRDSSRLSTAIGPGIAHARLGDKINAVVLAFSLVLKQIYPSKPAMDIMPSLRSLCGMIVGIQIEQPEDEGRDSEDSMQSDEEDAETVDQWYEAIPEHLRRYRVGLTYSGRRQLILKCRFVIIGHAMELVETALPMSLPRLWEDLLECCCKYGTLVEIEAILVRLLQFPLGSAPKPVPSIDLHFSPRYISELSQRFAQAVPESQRGVFTSLLIRAIKLCNNQIIWGHDGIQTYLEANRDSFETVAIFEALLATENETGKTRTRLRHWVKLILEIDFALPPDEDMQDDAVFWVHALSSCAIRLLKKSLNQFDGWRPAALCLGLHAFIRTEDHPSIREDILKLLQTLSEKAYAEIAVSKLPNADTLFSIIFPCLDRRYFFDAIHEYARAMWETDRLHAMESMFISSLLAFANRCARPNAYDEDPEPLLDDDQLASVREWQAKAEVRCKSQKSLALHRLRATSGPTISIELPQPAGSAWHADMSSPFAYIPKQVHRSREGAPLRGHQRKHEHHSSRSNAMSRFLPHLFAHSVTQKIPGRPVGGTEGRTDANSEEGQFELQGRSPSPESDDQNSCTSSSRESLLHFGRRAFTFAPGPSGVCYAQPPSWITDPQTQDDAEAAACASRHRRVSATAYLANSDDTTLYNSTSSTDISTPPPRHLLIPEWSKYDHPDAKSAEERIHISKLAVEPTPLSLRTHQNSLRLPQAVPATSAVSCSVSLPGAFDKTSRSRFLQEMSDRSQVPSRRRPTPPRTLSLVTAPTGSSASRNFARQNGPLARHPSDMLTASRRAPRASDPDPLDMLSTRPPTKKPRLASSTNHPR